MNKREREKRKRVFFGMLEHKSLSSVRTNSVRYHGDGWKHYMVKAAIGYTLQDQGHEFMTEAEFPNGRLADVLDLETGLVYEVETSASREDVREKVGNFTDYQPVQDVLVLDPTEFPDDLKELREKVEAEVV